MAQIARCRVETLVSERATDASKVDAIVGDGGEAGTDDAGVDGDLWAGVPSELGLS